MNRNREALSADQRSVVALPLNQRIWLEGIAGSGKTSVGVARALRLLSEGAPAESILIFVPQRSLASPYLEAMRAHSLYQGGQVSVHTIGSLALQMVEMFWFLASGRAGFKHPQDLPNFLSLELVQYFMTRAIEPLVNQRDYFNSVRIDRPRLYSQIVDNMNKAALVGFPISEIGARLNAALAGGVEQTHIFDDAQTCALGLPRILPAAQSAGFLALSRSVSRPCSGIAAGARVYVQALSTPHR